ncbi:MAG: pyridoxamine 5'-phosphate oxidase family protein [Candidatus Methylomirabilis oxygeniifera]|nr:MAG: pyridoxamine 5'-phosphate oxidase family protein [Candidatus Methylomirabilis oxyfera]
MLDRSSYIISMNRLSKDKRAQVVAALVEGNSIRSTVRMTGVAKGTVLKLLADLGAACSEYQRQVLVNLRCKRIQCDEIWSFCYAKEKNVPEHMKGKPGVGDVWTWTAMDADSKLMISWLVGERDAGYATEFINDLAARLATRVQLTTDGLKVYLEAIEGAFGADIDYAQLVKLFGEAPEQEKRYSPSQCTGCQKRRIDGSPDPRHVSTSFVERQNLTMRMSMRRFTRLTNAFSKKVENLEAAVALHFMWYNFGRIHQTLRVTPAMQAGVSDHVWTIEEILDLLDSN